jgi:hypothetical protein
MTGRITMSGNNGMRTTTPVSGRFEVAYDTVTLSPMLFGLQGGTVVEPAGLTMTLSFCPDGIAPDDAAIVLDWIESP